MSESPWAATYVRWQDDAECKDAGLDMVPDTESPVTLEHAVSALCNVCPVRADCLLYAMLHGLEGYWGGTSTAQRRKLRAKKDRAKCPVCLSHNLVKMSDHEICLSCGLSWTKGSHPRPELTLVSSPAVMERYL